MIASYVTPGRIGVFMAREFRPLAHDMPILIMDPQWHYRWARYLVDTKDGQTATYSWNTTRMAWVEHPPRLRDLLLSVLFLQGLLDETQV